MGTTIPPGYSPPFQVVDDRHHGAWIVITAALGLVVSLVSFLIRLYVKLALNPPLAYDDFVLLGATAIAVVQSSLLFDAVSHGLGTAIDLLKKDQVGQIQTLVGVSDILYVTTIYVTKCCVVGIYLRLTPQKSHNRASWATLALCTLWAIISVFMIAVNCEFKRPWKGPSAQCPHLLRRWEFIVSMDILTEIILFGLVVIILAGLFMSVKRKLTIGSAFVFRLPLVGFSIIHLFSLHRHINYNDPTLSVISPLIWAQVELNYALIACSVFCLRPFMAAVSTNYGTAGDSNLESSASRGSKAHNTSSSGKSESDSRSRSRPKSHVAIFSSGQGKKWRSMHAESSSLHVDHGHQPIELEDRGGVVGSVGAGESSRMAIRKDVQYTIEYKPRGMSDEGTSRETEQWDRINDQLDTWPRS